MSVKKYYWLKLKDDFFDDDTIQYIEEQDNGIAYSNFYLKLCLKSLKDDGKLIRYVGNNLIPYDIKSLSKLTGVDVDTVRSAMQLFQQIGLINILETGEIYLSQIKELIGSETDKARIMRKKRMLQKAITDCNSTVTGCNGNNVTEVLPKRYTEIEKEIDIEIEKDINTYCVDESKEKIPYQKIIECLNQFANTKYRHTTPKTQTLIHARWNEGFRLEDFQIVIKKKCDDWLGTNMEKYLRPETLFGTKFEGYLNEISKKKEVSSNPFIQMLMEDKQ